MSYEEKELSLDDMLKIIKESIKQGKGLISYRKHLELLFKMERRLTMLTEYRRSLVKDVDEEIDKMSGGILNIRESIKSAMETDESIEKTDTGGKTVFLPDLGTISLTKEQERIVIEDPIEVMKALGEQSQKVTITLDKTKAKAMINEIMSNNGVVPGSKTEKYRELKITAKK